MAKVGRAARVASRQRTETITGNKTIESAETGELYLLNGADCTITLPAAQEGAYFKFLVITKIASPAVVIQAAGSAKMAGHARIATRGGNVVIEANADAEIADGHTKLTVADSGSNHLLAGSVVECYSNGTNWYVTSDLTRDNSSVTVIFN